MAFVGGMGERAVDRQRGARTSCRQAVFALPRAAISFTLLEYFTFDGYTPGSSRSKSAQGAGDSFLFSGPSLSTPPPGCEAVFLAPPPGGEATPCAALPCLCYLMELRALVNIAENKNA